MRRAAPLALAWALTTLGACSTATGPSTLAELERRANAPVEPAADGPAPAVVIINATVMTATGVTHAPGYVAFAKGRITAVGPGAPPDTRGFHVIDAHGHVVTPGLIDAHSHLGVYPSPAVRAHQDGNEASAPSTPGAWAEHGLWPQDPGLELALRGGVTTLHVLPGSANLIGGRGVTIHQVPRRGSRAMRFPGAPATLKMACGENPKRVYGKRHAAPSTRMGNVREQRKAFARAAGWVAGGRKERDIGLETLAGVLEGRILAQVHCYRADDMLAILQLAEEFGFRIRAFHHALEAYKIRDILAKHGVAVATWADWWGFKLEAWDGIPENAAMVAAAGARAIIHSDSGRGIQRLNQEAAKALYAGRRAGLALTDDQALRWITAHPAWALGIDGQVGTLAAGKRADLVVWDASPFSVYANARWVFVDGRLRLDRDRKTPPWSDFLLGAEVTP